MLLCSNCGTENQENSRFCQNCGTSMEIQSSIVQVKKLGNNKSILVGKSDSRDERFRKAKILALKAVKDKDYADPDRHNVVYIGEKIL